MHALVHAGHSQHGRIVAQPKPQQRMRRQMIAEPGDEFAFHEGRSSVARFLLVSSRVIFQFYARVAAAIEGVLQRIRCFRRRGSRLVLP